MRVVRSFLAISAVCAVAVSFMLSPVAHTHAFADEDDHHASEQAHVHSREHRMDPKGFELGTPDLSSDERVSKWFVTTQPNNSDAQPTPIRTVLPEPARTGEVVRPAPALRSHDPPLLLNLPSRAPPVLSS